MTTYSLPTVRTLALHTQGLTAPLPAAQADPTPNMQAISNIVEQIGCVQIDTLQMVQRSHYLVLWSRLGTYDPEDFDRLVYHPDHRRLFEGWQHAASIIPLKDYRIQMPHQRYLRENPAKMSARWLAKPGSRELLEEVLERIRDEGGLRAADFKYEGPKRSGWWDWKPAKNALEHLYAWGDLMIADRVNFQRVYDLTERILPDWVEATEPTLEERDRYWLEMGARALGVATASQIADYTYRKLTPARSHIEALQADGTLVPIKARLNDGKAHSLIVHRDNLPTLESAADGALQAARTTFLSPFDSLFWARGRDMHLWGFRQTLEAYKPAKERIWGYFCLPILHRDRLVGRFDPKLERDSGTLRLKALYLEPGVEPDDALVASVASAMGDFLGFHAAGDLVIESSQPEDFARKLLARM